jgi:hypothetical protein
MWSLVGGKSYVEINGFEFDGSNHDVNVAINGTAVFGAKILNNKFHDVMRQASNPHAAVVTVDSDAGQLNPSVGGNNFYIGNIFYHNNWGAPGGGANPYAIYVQKPGDVIQNNLIMQQGGGWCVQLWHQATNAVVTNNTFINCARGGVVNGNDGTQAPFTNDHTTIDNNIVANNGWNGGQYGIIESAGKCDSRVGPNNLYNNNVMWNNVPTNLFLCGGKTASGIKLGTNTSVFVNYTGDITGDYHLKAGSPAIGAGTTACAPGGISPCIPTTDITGKARPNPPSIGAYEQ